MREQNEALHLADQLEAAYPNIIVGLAPAAAKALREQHAVIDRLLDMLFFSLVGEAFEKKGDQS